MGHERYNLIEELIHRIDDEGQISAHIQGYAGMIDLVRGRYEQGLDRLMQHNRTLNPFYAGLTFFKMGESYTAIRIYFLPNA